MRPIVWLTLALASASCGSAAPDPGPDGDLRVLFIGNSLTEANDLPGMVSSIADGAGTLAITVEAVDLGGASLEDHWHRGEALAAIEHGGWDVVVLQQGPSALPESRVLLLDYAHRFADRIRAAGARPALYMVWPPLDRAGDWDAVTESYTAAARAVDGLLFPAGEALREALRRKPTLDLLQTDRFHPTATGTLSRRVGHLRRPHRPLSDRAGPTDRARCPGPIRCRDPRGSRRVGCPRAWGSLSGTGTPTPRPPTQSVVRTADGTRADPARAVVRYLTSSRQPVGVS
jgi:hypothetical protein